MKHGPTPWRHERRYNLNQIRDSKGGLVAIVPKKCNRDLLLAAPEMLMAIKVCLGYVDLDRIRSDDPTSKSEFQRRLEILLDKIEDKKP